VSLKYIQYIKIKKNKKNRGEKEEECWGRSREPKSLVRRKDEREEEEVPFTVHCGVTGISVEGVQRTAFSSELCVGGEQWRDQFKRAKGNNKDKGK
jgi:hypothetical protein